MSKVLSLLFSSLAFKGLVFQCPNIIHVLCVERTRTYIIRMSVAELCVGLYVTCKKTLWISLHRHHYELDRLLFPINAQ